MAKDLHLVVFSLGTEFYGVGIDSLQEIVMVPEITGVPDAPDYLEGVINMRGKIVPVIDLRKRMKLQETARSKANRVLITENNGAVGLLVDSASEVLRLRPDAIEEPPGLISAIGVEYITGVAKNDGRLIILLDIKKILSVGDTTSLSNNVESLQAAEAA